MNREDLISIILEATAAHPEHFTPASREEIETAEDSVLVRWCKDIEEIIVNSMPDPVSKEAQINWILDYVSSDSAPTEAAGGITRAVLESMPESSLAELFAYCDGNGIEA